MKNSKKSLLALISAFLWGTTFVAQTANYLGTLSFNAFRSFISLFFLIPAILIQTKGDVRHVFCEKDKLSTKKLIVGGILCGVALTLASFLQQYGIDCGTESGKAGFITAMYIVLVPIFGLFLKKRSNIVVYLCVFLASIGLYLLCIKDGFSIRPSDAYVLASAVAFAIHIHIIDSFSPYCNGFKLSCIQFITVGILSLIPALLFEHDTITWQNFSQSIIPLLYAGILSSGIAYTLQIIAQKGTNPTVTSVLLSTESLFGVLAGAIVLHEVFTPQEYIGCALMLIAIILTQIPIKKRSILKK